MPTQQEQDLYDVAKAALPGWLFADDANAQELIWAFVKQFAATRSQVDFYVDQVFITRAVGAFLDELAKDKGTRRQTGEDDVTLAERLRSEEDMVSIPSLQAKIVAILAVLGITATFSYTGNAGIVELRQDKAHYAAGSDIQVNAVAVASLVVGEEFVVGGLTFEFVSGGAPSTGNIAVDLAGLTTAAQVATAIATAGATVWTETGRVYASTIYTIFKNVLGVASEAVADAGFACFRQASYYTTGQRYGVSLSPGNVLIVILPYGTTEDQANIVAESLRQIKAGGVSITVERRLNP